jgi:hypothetical protein
MTVGELRELLAKLDSQLKVEVALNGSFVPVIEVAAYGGTDFILIRGKGKTPQAPKYSIQEQGLIGHLVRLGFDNDKIGEVLGRTTKSVEGARKRLGF